MCLEWESESHRTEGKAEDSRNKVEGILRALAFHVGLSR